MSAPHAFVSHAVAGRSRWRIPSRKGDAAYFRELEKHLSALPDVVSVEGRPRTGSLVLRHHGDAMALVRRAEEEGLIALLDEEPTDESLTEEVGTLLDTVDDWLTRKSGGKLDLPTGLFLLFGTAAIVQFMRGRVAAPAATLGWYALNALLLARTAAAQRAFQSRHGNGSDKQ